MRAVVAYLGTLVVFLAVDLVWLGVIARDFYRNALGDLMQVDLGVAFAFYALYVVGIVIFAVWPADERGSLRHAAIFGGLFGLFCYATYDLTNLATLKDWPWIIAVVDIPWGVFLTSVSAMGGYLALRVTMGVRQPA
ncbi:MAG: DUF2177 family protein [Pseudomonadota bacterium]